MRSSQERELKQHSLQIDLVDQSIKFHPSQNEPTSQYTKGKPHKQNENFIKQIREHFRDKLIDQHKIPIEELCQRLAVNLKSGLSSDIADSRRRQQGPNIIPGDQDPTRLTKYFTTITNWLSIPLWISSVLLIISFCINHQNVTSLGLVIFIILLILLIGFFSYSLIEEPRQNKFKSTLPPVCRVLRNGLATSIRQQDVVRGDIVLIMEGCVIPADLRIYKSDELKVVNEKINGCKQILSRSANFTDQSFLQTQNIVFKGTVCVYGTGIGIAISTGANTVAGYKTQLLNAIPKIKPYLSHYLQSLMRLLTLATSITIVLSVVMMAIFEFTLFECLEIVSGITLANTPQALLICISLSKAVTCKILADNKILVKGFRELNGLSQISCICLAKCDLVDNYGQGNNLNNKQLELAKAVERCKVQGVKIVLYTRESPQAALAFGKQIGLITMKSNIEYQQQGLSSRQALQKARSIIVDGQLIKANYQISEQQGDYFLDYSCTKKQVIFTNISTTQKLAVVRSCKRIGQTVSAWTDGYIDFIIYANSDVAITNSSSGSSISLEAADVILLDDNFASIIEGITISKTHFKNIRKSIIYLLTSNMAEILPFLAVVFFRIPPPLSCVLTLYISLITDIYSGVSLAFEQAQNCILTRFIPENQLKISTIMIQSYGILGVYTFCAGLFTYNLIIACYGIPFQIYYQLLSRNAYIPQAGISFNSYQGSPDNTFELNTSYLGFVSSDGSSTYYNGNCDISSINDHYGYPNWFTTANNRVDLRAVFVECCSNLAQNGYCPQFDWPAYSQTVQTISPISGVEVAYTTEALFYAQSGYFSTIVMVQWVNLFVCKSRNTSLIYTAPNYHMFGGVLFSICFMVFGLYVPGVNSILGGRPLPFFMLAIPGTGFSSLMLLGAEIHKKMIRQ